MIRFPNEMKDICFDLDGPNGKVFNLVHDPETHLVINAEIVDHGFGKHHADRLSKIGVISPMGNKVELFFIHYSYKLRLFSQRPKSLAMDQTALSHLATTVMTFTTLVTSTFPFTIALSFATWELRSLLMVPFLS